VKFALPWWLAGTALALVVAVLLIWGGAVLLRSVRRFGDEERVLGLVTGRAGGRRALKGVLLVLAVAFGFVALAQPQYGRGTRLIPATNLDVVIVLDFSKSMFAQDVSPSRIERAKSEVSRLISDLPGARFAAIAFAGEPIGFPLTSDGGAIAQFFRQLSPNDMPVGGTAIGRALEAGRELLERDPLSKKHRRVMLLVTDGEDLEGDPVSVAQSASENDISIHVVQIGGRTPEPLPDVNEAGEVKGWRTDDAGRPITTSLTAEGEATLAKIAEVSGGTVVRSERGSTGIREVASRLRRMMTEELSERVETVYADVFYYPLGLAILLLLVDVFVSQTPKRALPSVVPPPRRRPRRRKPRRRGERAAAAAGIVAITVGSIQGGCEQADDLFLRNSPAVDDAIDQYDAGDAAAAAALLQKYLSTGECEGGELGVPQDVRDLPFAGFDLGLALFRIGETFGGRFGEEEAAGDAGLTPDAEANLSRRSQEVDCALRVVRAIAGDGSVPIELRARAHYLAGNLEFLRREYRAAVSDYDLSLRLIPGLPEDAGDGIGRDAAWNRAIALRRIEDEEQDAGADAPPDAPPDADDAGDDSGDAGDDEEDSGDDAGPDASDGGDEGGPEEDQDGGEDQSDQPDAGGEDAGQEPDAGSPQQQEPPPESQGNQDERMLDMLERAPTLQQENAKNRALQRRVGGMVDK
jgi:Ca-activated chloride channel family protein